MVEDSISDPVRIAELLASELTGLSLGPLAAVTVVDADESAEPSADGTAAYDVAVDGRPVGTVRLYPDATVLEVDCTAPGVSPVSSDGDGPDEGSERDDFAVERDGDAVRVSVTSGAAVKRAVDELRSLRSDA